ncbi:hypothetical protein GCM10010246_80220 [Streptomyces cuspidosporus]|uniref:Uncharacterized protein n=1 Tax=Streptomyces cuspidosporus TaxID=66882 RepID=A0ABN3H9M8_9ACTN
MPVGVPVPSGITVAVTVTDWPTTAGFGVTVTRVIVGLGMMSPPCDVLWVKVGRVVAARCLEPGGAALHVLGGSSRRLTLRHTRAAVPRQMGKPTGTTSRRAVNAVTP